MIGTVPALDWRLIGGVAFGLVMFGLFYNGLMDRLRDRSGYTSIFVSGGVIVTLAGVAIINWQAALLTLCAFACSGLPMIIGSMLRHMQEQEQARKDLQRVFDDAPEM